MIDDEEDRTSQDEQAAEEAGPPQDAAPAEEASAEEAGDPQAGAPADEPAAEQEAAAPEGGAPADEPAAEPEAAATEAAGEPEVRAEEAAPAGREAAAPRSRSKRDREREKEDEPEAIPGAHLEPDLVLEDTSGDRGDVGGLAGAELEAAEEALEERDGDLGEQAVEEAPTPAPAPVPTTVLDLAADARYRATGKRKQAVARVILKPGTGVYMVNGREMTAFFPRPTLQTIVRQPLQTVGHEERMDVVAKIHGGGVSAQAGALRHGISKALTEADPNLRGELKSRGFLTRDPRVKERKKAGLKKARKRPQFSKR